MDRLGINSQEYGALLAPVIIERLPHQLNLIIGRNIKDKIWDLTKILSVINEELIARENCSIIDERGGKSYLFRKFHDENPALGSALLANQRFKNKCVFFKGLHWSDKCEVISDPSARKEFLKSAKRCFLCLKEGHLSRNCQTKRTCYYRKGFHNSSVCENRETQRLSGNPQSTNSVNNKNFVLLKMADVILFNGFNKKEVRIKALFDLGS